MEIVLIIFIPCLIKLSKEIPALAEQRQVHYNSIDYLYVWKCS
jgi:hypothetical protein